MKKTILFLMMMLFTVSLVFGVTLPHTENFDGVTAPDLPAGWDKINDTGDASACVKTMAYYYHSAPNSVRIFNAWATTGNVMLISPILEGASITDTRVKFWARKGPAGEGEDWNVIVGTMTDPDSAATFTPVTTIALTMDYVEYSIVLSGAPSGDKYVAFKNPMDAGWNQIHIDDFAWDEVESGFITGKVTLDGTGDVTAATVTADGVTTHPAADSTYSIPIAVGHYDVTAELFGFEPVTKTNVHVTADETTAVDFTLVKNYVTLPYTQNFDGVTPPALPYLWAKINDTGAQYSFLETTTFHPHSDPNCVYMGNGSATTGNIMLISPPIDSSINTTRVRFWAKHIASETEVRNIIVGTMSDWADAATFTAVDTIAITDTYSECTAAFTEAPSDHEYVAFKHGMDDVSDVNYIDDVTWELIPADPEFSVDPDFYDFGTVDIGWPSTTGIVVTNIGGGTLNITAAEIVGVDADQFSVDTSNLPAALGANQSLTLDVTYAPDSEGLAVASLVITDDIRETHEVTLMGTGRDPSVSLPYTQNFDEVTVPELPLDWRKINDLNDEDAFVKTHNYNAHSDSIRAMLFNNNNLKGNLLLIPPACGSPIQTTRIRFWAKKGQFTTTAQNLIIGTMSDPTDAMTFAAVDTVSLTQTYAEYTVNLVSAPETDKFVAFKHAMDANYQDDHIDDFTWELLPDPGFITGTVMLDGVGDVTLATVTADYVSVNPATDGTYSIEIIPGTYEVTAELAGFEPVTIEDVVVTTNATTDSIDFTLAAMLNPPVNVAVSGITDSSAVLAWDAPVGIPTGYNVYLDDTPVATNIEELTYIFTGLELGTEYVAGVQAVYAAGVSEIVEESFGTTDAEDTPVLKTTLGGNYPNPFNPETTISFTLTTENTEGNTEIEVYNVKGQKVRALVDGKLPAGHHSVTWNGKDDNGNSVSSGIYFYRMSAGRYTSTKKMILMK